MLGRVAEPPRTETYPQDKRAGYLGGTDQPAALRIYGTPHELALLAGQLVFQLGRNGDLRANHAYLASLHLRIERQGNYLKLENISTDQKNALVFEGRAVETYCLVQPGDRFKIGDTVYYVLNEEMRMARRKVAQVLGETNDAAIDDCLIIGAKDASRHVVLVGPPGGGQKTLANALHQCSTRRRSGCVTVPPASAREPADPQLIEDAKDGTLVIEVPHKTTFDPAFVARAVAPEARVRLVICVHAPGKLAKSFPASITRNIDTITIPPIRERRDELPVILDHWFVEHRSPLRFREIDPKVQRKLLAYKWPDNLQEVLNAAYHLNVLAYYKSEREAVRDQNVARGKSRAFRDKLGLPLPIVPSKETNSASHKKVKR